MVEDNTAIPRSNLSPLYRLLITSHDKMDSCEKPIKVIRNKLQKKI